MKPKKPLILMIASLIISWTVCVSQSSLSYEEKLIQIQVERELGFPDADIQNEPPDIQALLLDYSEDKELVLKAWIALKRYPDEAKEAFRLYGLEPEFIEILKTYGETTIPVIHYFIHHEIRSLSLMHTLSKSFQSAGNAVKHAWSGTSNQGEINRSDRSEPAEIGPKERGWYAVNLIKEKGHGFLGQFALDHNRKKVEWIQTERVLEGMSSFFAGGIRTLETKYVLDDAITRDDLLWAGVDIVAVAGTFKLLRAGKAVTRSGKQLSLTTRTRLLAPKLLSKGKVAQRIAAYSAMGATAYLILNHPGLVNSLFTEAAKHFGIDPRLVQFAGWALILFFALYLFAWIQRLIIHPLIGMLSLMSRGLAWLEKPMNREAVQKKTPPVDSIAA